MATSKLLRKASAVDRFGNDPENLAVSLTAALRKFTPYGDRMLVEPISLIPESVSGIVLPDVVTSPDQLRYGKVAFQSETITSTYTGKYVAFHRNVGTHVRVDETDYLIVRENDLWGEVDPVLTEEKSPIITG